MTRLNTREREKHIRTIRHLYYVAQNAGWTLRHASEPWRRGRGQLTFTNIRFGEILSHQIAYSVDLVWETGQLFRDLCRIEYRDGPFVAMSQRGRDAIDVRSAGFMVGSSR